MRAAEPKSSWRCLCSRTHKSAGEKAEVQPRWWTNEIMKPTDIQTIGDELAIKWNDGSESFVTLEKLRRHCPCAGCKGETDIMGQVYKGPDKPLPPAAFQLRRIGNVGGYALQPVWGDGHSTGLFSFDYLKRVADAPS